MKLFIPITLFLLSFGSRAQVRTYTVIEVQGNICRPDHQPIRVGDKVTSRDTIVVHSVKDYLIVLNRTARYRVAYGDRPERTRPGGLLSLLVGDWLSLHRENIRLGSYGGENGMELTDFFRQTVINGVPVSDRVIIPEELRIPLRKTGHYHADNRESFFFLQLRRPGGAEVTHRLAVSNDTLVLAWQDFLVNGRPYRPADGRFTIGYVRNFLQHPVSEEIATIQPVYLTRAEIVSLIHAVQKALQGEPREIVITEIYTDLYLIYGKSQRNLIEQLYDAK